MPPITISMEQLLGPLGLTVFLLAILFFGGKFLLTLVTKLVDDKFKLHEIRLEDCHKSHDETKAELKEVKTEVKGLRSECDILTGQVKVYQEQSTSPEALAQAVGKVIRDEFSRMSNR